MFGISQQERYESLLAEKRTWFDTVGSVFCPILNEEVYFIRKGFKHLLRDGTGRNRNVKERMYKLGLLPLVIPVIKTATAIHDYREDVTKKEKKYQVWELKEFVGNRISIRPKPLVSVILRKNGTGNIFFYSVRKKRQNNTI